MTPCAPPASAPALTNVFSGEWLIGRIYERKGFPDAVRFFWSLHGVALTRAPDIHTDGHTPSLEAAKAEFKSNPPVRAAGY